MSEETVEVFQAMKQSSRERKRRNLEHSTQLLRDKGIPFKSFAHGIHLVVADCVDFWPSTGVFIPRDNRWKRGRGVKNLLEFLRIREARVAALLKLTETACNKP